MLEAPAQGNPQTLPAADKEWPAQASPNLVCRGGGRGRRGRRGRTGVGARKFDSWIAEELGKLDAVAELSIIFQ